jgi:deoxyribonuclease V
VEVRALHSWNVGVEEAQSIQERLRSRIVLRPLDRSPRLIAGGDASYDDRRNLSWSAIVVLDLGDFRIVETATASCNLSFPYVPGLFAFREAPSLLQAWKALRTRPDVLLIDGHGTAHPLRFGLASHLGLWLNLPTIGCAKTPLAGEFRMPGPDRGDRAPIINNGARVGLALRTRERVKPLFVSPGHLIDIRDSARVVLACCRRYRQPEPLREANRRANALRRRSRRA